MKTHPQPLTIQPWATALPWSKEGDAGEGSPSCICTLCGDVIGTADDDWRRENHEDDCPGCRVCEIAIRLFRGEGKHCEQQRYHGDCFGRILSRAPTLGPAGAMPTDYKQPFGGPYYWRDEVSGVLAAAVTAFLNDKREPSTEHLGLVRDYVLHWLRAPCWRYPGDAPLWDGLVEKTQQAQTRAALLAVLHELTDWGIDPL